MLAFSCLLLASASPQVPVPDDSLLVATTDGVFFVQVELDITTQVATPAQFGVAALTEPSVAWIQDTGSFILSLRSSTGQGGLFRLTWMPPGPAFRVEDLGSSITQTPFPDFRDLDYEVAHDVLYLLDHNHGRIFVLQNPENSTGADLQLLEYTPPQYAVGLSVHGAHYPYAMEVVTDNTVERMQLSGKEVLLQQPSWDQVDSHPARELYYLLSEGGVVGRPLGSGLTLNANTAGGACRFPMQKPVAFAWDPVRIGLVMLAEDGVLPCAFQGLAQGPNHLAWFPEGQGVVAPVLLTPAGPSGITGVDGDFALVHHYTGSVTMERSAGTLANGSQPVLRSTTAPLLGGVANVELEGAPRGAPVHLVVGDRRLDGEHQGQWVFPYPQQIHAAVADSSGGARIQLSIPNQAQWLGTMFYAQWWVHDTTSAAVGDLVASQGAIYRIGTR